MGFAMSNAQVMQGTSDFHDQIREVVFAVAKGVFDNSATLNTSNCMFNANPKTRNDTVQKAIFDGSLLAFWLFFRLVSNDRFGFITLKACIFA